MLVKCMGYIRAVAPDRRGALSLEFAVVIAVVALVIAPAYLALGNVLQSRMGAFFQPLQTREVRTELEVGNQFHRSVRAPYGEGSETRHEIRLVQSSSRS